MIKKLVKKLISLLPRKLILKLSKLLVNTVLFISYDEKTCKVIILKVIDLIKLESDRFVEVLCEDLQRNHYQVLLSDDLAVRMVISNKYIHSMNSEDIYIKQIND